MKFRLKHAIVIAAGVGVVAAMCALLLPKRLDAEAFSVRIDSAAPSYDGFDIQVTLTNESSETRHLMGGRIIFELKSGSSEAYEKSKALDQDLNGRSEASDVLYLRNCPIPDQNGDHFRLVYVFTEPYEPPPQIVHNAYSLFLDRGPPTWFTDLYEPRTHNAASEWFPIPTLKIKN